MGHKGYLKMMGNKGYLKRMGNKGYLKMMGNKGYLKPENWVNLQRKGKKCIYR